MKKIFVFKCGGGDAIKNAESIRRLYSILKEYVGIKILLVVSAFQGITNLLEDVVETYLVDTDEAQKMLRRIHNKHLAFAKELMLPVDSLTLLETLLSNKLSKIQTLLSAENFSYPRLYSEIVSMGEKYSALIVSSYFAKQANVKYVSAETLIYTTGELKNADISENATFSAIQRFRSWFTSGTTRFVVTEGFTGSTHQENPVVTTLGREGSDITAAVIANMIGAHEVGYFKKYAYHMHDPETTPGAQYLPEIDFERLERDITNPEGRKTILHEKTLSFLKKNYGEQMPIIKIIEFSDTSKQTLVVR